MSKKLIALLMAAMMLLSLAAACGNDTPAPTPSEPTPAPAPADPTPAPTPADPAPAPEVDPDADKYGGDLVVGASNVSSSMDMHHGGASAGNTQWYSHVYENIVVEDANGKVYGEICDFEQSPDGLKYTFTLRERYFSNGKRITMDDIEASIRRLFAVAYKTEADFEKWWGGSTVTFTDEAMIVEFEEYNVNFLPNFASPANFYKVMPKEICDKYAFTGGTTTANGFVICAEAPLINVEEDVIGSGPYTLTKWTDGADITLTRNENYQIITEGNEDAIGAAAPRKAYCDTITFAQNTDAASRTAALMAHEYHIATIQGAMKDSTLAMGILQDDAGTSWTHGIFFNLHETNADSPIADVNVRKAIRACLDVKAIMLSIVSGDNERIIEDTFSPYAISTKSVYASTKMEDSGEWNVADKELAKQYLAQSSYNGEPIVYLTPSSGNFYNAAMAIIPQLEEIGLNIEPMIVESGSHAAMRKDPATGHDIGCWEVQKVDSNPVLHTTFVTGTQGWWSSDAKAAALDVMKTTPTGSEESIAAYNDYLDAVIDECPYILFGHPMGVIYRWPEVEINRVGKTSYYWNSYFVD